MSQTLQGRPPRTGAGLPRVAVIGAGSSGITALKTLREAGLDTTAYEAGSFVGGNWVLDNDNGMSSSYRTLHINTSRERMEYSDFPMPKSFPDFPHHSHIRRYFSDYTTHFGLGEHIRFRTPVTHAAKAADGSWELELGGQGAGETVRYDALVVANGHHWDPRWPDPAYPGHFDGQQMHAHYFRDNEAFRDRVVLVVGMGNSAMDIAVESSWVARRTLLSARRGVHVIPKYLLGKPLDQITTGRAARLPWRLRQAMNERLLATVVGRPERYGLPAPTHGIFQAHPTISDTILSRIAHGAVTPKPGVDRLDADSIVFADGSREHVDVVVWATGYHVTFPFFDKDFISAPDNDLPLYKRIFHPTVAGVYFVGLAQPLGATMPMAESQAKLVADHLRGRYALPPAAALPGLVEAERDAVRRRYVASPRHTMQVDYDVYVHDLKREQRLGAQRAARTGYRIPVPVQAAG